jgi:tetratricopeptide (TPR) repeat protein
VNGVERCVLVFAIPALVATSASAKGAEPRTPPLRIEKGVLVQPCGAELREGAAAVFLSDVPCLEARIDVRDVTGSHVLRFQYYDPTGNLYVATKEDWKLSARTKKSYHRTGVVRHQLSIAGEQASLLIGTWRVAVVLDDIAVADGTFRIERRPPPENEDLAKGRELYLGLEYERAIERLTAAVAAAGSKSAAAEGLWWLSLSLLSVGKRDEAVQHLHQLLQADPMYALSQEAAKKAGAEELYGLLEDLRNQSYPELYRKTAVLPEAELSKPERAPVVKKRKPLWKKLVYYVGIPVVAVGALTVIAAIAVSDRLSNPPILDFEIDEARAEREPRYGGLCQGAVPVAAQITGGVASFDLVVTAARLGGTEPASVPGLVASLGGTPIVLLVASGAVAPSFDLSEIDVQGPAPGSSRILFEAVLRDSKTPADFKNVRVGQPLPTDLRDSSVRFDPLNRLVSQVLFEVLVSDCRQVPTARGSR